MASIYIVKMNETEDPSLSTNHNSFLRPGSKSLRSVATRLLTCCQKRVFSVKYPTTKIIIKYRISDWIASFLHFSIKADEFQKLSMYPSFPLFILTLGKGASGIGKPKNWHRGVQPSFTLKTNSCFSGTRSFLRFKNLKISKDSGYIDVSDGCSRPNVLVTSLWCWWPIQDVGDRFNTLRKSAT